MAQSDDPNEVLLFSFFGLNLIYWKGREHGVGTVPPPLLPAKFLRYRVHFDYLFQTPSSSGTFIPLASGAALGPLFSFDSSSQKISYVFDLRFLSSRPIFNRIIQVTAEDVENGYLQTSKNIVMVGYVVRLTPTEESEGVILDVTDAEENIPGKPTEDQHVGYADDYFAYYQEFRDPSFSAGDINSTTNVFDQLVKPLGADYRYDRSRFFDRDSVSNHIAIKNELVEGDYYAVTYDEVTEYQYAQFHRINMSILSIGLVPGVDFNFPDVRRQSPMYFYAYKEWISTDGQAMKGWRISEAYNGPVNAYLLDSSGNVDMNPQSTPEHVFYNMVEESLQKKDEERIAYQDSVAEIYLELASANGLTQDDEDFDPDALSPDQVRSDNFEIYQSNDRRVVGGTYVNPTANVVFENSAPVTLESSGGKQFGYWESDFHYKPFAKNTRCILAFDSGISKNTIITIAGQQEVTIRSQSSAQDPLYFNVTDGKLNYFVFGIDSFELDLPLFVEQGLAYREEKFGATAHLGVESDGATGKSLILEDYSYKTFIDDSNVDGTPDSPEVSENVKLSVIEKTPSASLDEDADIAVSYFNVERDEVISQISVKAVAENSVVKIRGWENTPDEIGKLNLFEDQTKPLYELSSIYLGGIEGTIQVDGWTDITFIEIFYVNEVSKYVIVDQEKSPNNFINNADSVGCMASKSGLFFAFYTTGGGRMNLLISNNFGDNWRNYENIFMRGGRMSNIRSIVNQDDDTLTLFHYYKENSLLMTRVETSLVNVSFEDIDKQAALLDQIRTKECYLVWGDIDNESGIKDNILLTFEDDDIYFSSRVIQEDIINSNGGEGSYPTYDLSEFNKFIRFGSLTESQLLTRQDCPKDADYDVYENSYGVLKLLAIDDEGDARFIESRDDGLNWSNVWTVEEEPKIKINSLKPISGEEIAEGEYVSTIYNPFEEKVYIFYFYEKTFLIKVMDDNQFEEFDSQEELSNVFNSLPIYALCGELNNVDGYRVENQSEDDGEEDENEAYTSTIIFNDFQKNEIYFERFYGELYYLPQKVTGYTTDKGYMRVFLVNNNKTVDSFYYDGFQWYPENVMLMPVDEST
jgi:hypothetical protein